MTHAARASRFERSPEEETDRHRFHQGPAKKREHPGRTLPRRRGVEGMHPDGPRVVWGGTMPWAEVSRWATVTAAKSISRYPCVVAITMF